MGNGLIKAIKLRKTKKRRVGGISRSKKKRKVEERRKKKEERGGKREMGKEIQATCFVFLPRASPRTSMFFNFFQGKTLHFKPLNPCVICWDNVRINFLIYFMENG